MSAISGSIQGPGFNGTNAYNPEPPAIKQENDDESPLMSLPEIVLLNILSYVPDYKTHRLSDDLHSNLLPFAQVSLKAYEVAIVAKRQWASREHISLKTFGCTTAEEAIQYVIKHNLKSANLIAYNSETTQVTQEQLQRLCVACPKLEYLWVRSRSIQSLEDLPRMDFLHTLNCSGCAINELPENLAEKFPKLERLRCYNCNLTALPRNIPHLLELDCRYMQIRAIPETFTNLTGLDMEQCPIRTIPDALAQTLKVLSCDGSLLERLPESFPQLQVLHVARCTRLTALPKSLPSLIHLSDSGSGIRQRPLMPKIVSLNYTPRNHQPIEDFIAFH